MATIVRLGEPKPDPSPRKDEPRKQRSEVNLSDLQESGLLLKIGIGVGVAAVIAVVCFFLFRGPSEEASTLAPGNGLPVLGGPPTAPLPGAATPAAGTAAGTAVNAYQPGSPVFNPGAVPAPPMLSDGIAPSAPVGAGFAPPHLGSSTARNGSATTSGGTTARPAVTKSTQPGPTEDPYARENR